MNITQSQPDEEYVLFGKVDNVRILVTLLKAIHIRETATVFASDKGLKVVVDDSKCAQAIAFIESAVFHQYHVKEDNITFVVNLNDFLECLNVFGTGNSTALQLCYSGYGSPLIIILEEEGVITDCQLKTQDADEVLDFDFASANITNKVILNADVVRDVWNDLDMASDTFEITLSPNKPHLRFSTFGTAGNVQIEFSRSSDAISTFECTQSQVNRYKMNLMKNTSKALSVCSKLSVRTDDRGFLNIQFMISTEGEKICFVEYYVAPDEDFDSE